MPKLAEVTCSGSVALAWPFAETVTVPLPVAADDGMIAVTCVADTDTIGAATDAPFTVTCTDVPPSVVCSGLSDGAVVDDPRFVPLIVKIDPRAMPALGNPEITWLAAFR